MASRSETLAPPRLETHSGIWVARDDLHPLGGTKGRFIADLFEQADELVYATPSEGGAQYAIAKCAQALGKRATLFVAKRKQPHPRVRQSKALGAKVIQVSPGYMSVCQARARQYAHDKGAMLAPFGLDMPAAVKRIAAAAAATEAQPEEVWCAAGSGTLARGLATAWPQARLRVVQIGRTVSCDEVAGADIIKYPKPFGARARAKPPFPADPHYDAKAWEIANARRGAGQVLFWNVAPPP